MSDLLNSASLVMIPSGYKEDTVFSQIPTDGSGDLSFTRASNGTRINSAGLVEVCPWNLAQYSEDFSNAVWQATSGGTGSNPGVTANDTTAPNGTTTADKIVFNTGAGTSATDQSIIYQNISTQPAGIYTLSIYAKVASGTAKILARHATGGSYTTLNLTTDWQRFEIVETNPIDQVITLQLGLRRGLANEPLTSPVTCFLWGAQLNIGSTAKPYFPTTDRLNVPRLTYQNGGGGCPSLLLEKQSTNFQTYSQDFTNVAWTKLGQGVGDTSVVTANYAISPDGTQNATRFVCNLNGGTTSSDRSWMIASFTAQATSTISIWIKLNSAGTKTVLLSDSGGGTKTISGTDWQRIDATFVGAGGEFRIGLIGGSTSDTLDCCIWGAQAEAGTYPTSYIPTTSASATRVADACYKTGISSLIGQTEGVMFIDLIASSYNADGTSYSLLATLSESSTNFQLYTNNSLLRYYISASGTEDASTGITLINGGRYKIALAYKGGSSAVFVNGSLTNTSTKSVMPTAENFYLNQYMDGSLKSSNSFNQAILFPTRLTNAELASLTTI
jgi:hypothetical protein